MTLPPAPIIRPVNGDDDLERLTKLIHAAYAPHAKLGLRYWGTHQSVGDTIKRFASGTAERVNDFAAPTVINLLCRTVSCSGRWSPMVVG